MCRLYSRRISTLKPQLDANNVRLIGIGLEELGVEGFVEGKFWDGELYIDTKKECFKELGYKRMSFFGAIGAVFGKKGRDMISKTRQEKISGDLKGDALQNGGTIIITAGGKEVLLNFVQEGPSDHVPLEDVLRVLGIEGAPPGGEGASSGGAEAKKPPEVVCNEDVCQIKK